MSAPIDLCRFCGEEKEVVYINVRMRDTDLVVDGVPGCADCLIGREVEVDLSDRTQAP